MTDAPGKDKKTILVVEDEVDLREALVRALQSAGYAVRQVTNGREGVAAVEQELPDMILLDLLMPEMSGQEMMHAIEELPGGADIPVIVLTNIELNDKAVKQVSRNRPTWYFVKSDWSLEELIEKINIFLGPKS